MVLRRGLLCLLAASAACSQFESAPDPGPGGGVPSPGPASPLGGSADRQPAAAARFLSGRYDLRAYRLAPALLQLSLAQSGVWALDRVSLTRGEQPPPLSREGLIGFGRGADEDQFPAGFCPAELPFMVDLGSFLRQLHHERGLKLPEGRYTVLVEGRFTPLEHWPPEARELQAGDRFEVTLYLDL